MEKKQLISVVKPLIAAALLFGSSGGVAWGQIYKSQRNPDKAQASADKKERAQLRGGIGGSIDTNPTGHNWWNGSWDVTSSFTVENNYGPGETGTLKPKAGISTNTGTWIYGSSNVNQGFNVDGGIITVGGTNNHVGHMAKKGAGVTTLDYDSGYGLQGTATSATASASLAVTSSCGSNNSTQYSGYLAGTPPRNDSQDDNISPGILSSGWSRSFTRYYGIAHARVTAPTTPNGDGVRSSGTPPTYSPTETAITIDGRNNAPQTPWHLQKFNFLENKWYYYITTFTHFTLSHTVEFDYYIPTYNCVTCGSSNCPSWNAPSLHTATGTSAPHKGVDWATSSGTVGGTLNARIQLVAGSHVRLTGSGNKSIGHGTLGGTTAYLNLPANYYTLMNDEPVVFGSIVYNSNGGNSVDPVLGTDAVFGINKTLDKDLKTNTNGGTILIGAISRTDATSQGKITIQAATVNAGEPLGFAASGDVVYTGTCIPKAGTANLGNYQSNSPEEITVDNNLNLPTSLGAGALQIFNTRHNLVMDKTYATTVGGTGHMLIMAYKTLKTTKALSVTGSGSGNTNLVGGDVDLGADETYTGTSTGSYRVIAYGNGNHIPPSFSGFTVNWGSCTAAHSWCSNTEQTRFLNTNDPTSDVSSRTSNSGSAGNTFKANYSCFNAFGGNNGDITNSAVITSTVSVGTSSSTARWQAARHININAASTFNWTSSGSGDMWWAAQDDIYPQGTITWKKSGTSSGVAYWQAGNNIEVTGTNTLTANWDIGATGTNAMRWLARNDIKFPTGSTVIANWKTLSAVYTGNILWEAGHDIVSEATLTANWEVGSNAAGSARWLAKRNIDITLPGSSSIAWKADAGSTGDLEWIAGGNLKVDNIAASPVTFTQLGKTGNTLWQAVGNIEALGPKTFTNSSTGTGNPGTGGKTIWNAREHIITGNGTANTPPQTVEFKRTTDNAGLMAWQAGKDIRTGSKTKFTNTASGNISNMEWFACNNIFTRYGATSGDANDDHDVTFTNDGKGSMIWHANTGNIETRSKTSFNNSGDGHMTWYARKNIKTYFGTQTTSDQLNQGIIFTQTGKGRTVWFAEDDNIETRNPVHFNWSSAADDATSIMWWAGTHIEIGNNYSTSNPEQSRAKFETGVNDTILLKSKNGHILTNSQVDIERTNTGKALTKLWAGCGTYRPSNGITTQNNIDIENVFNYTEPSGGQAAGALVHLYAENDILSNKDAANGTCDTRQAPITFSVVPSSSKTITLWEAERNINTDGRVDFLYGTASSAGPLTWLSRAGYIQTERPVTIAYKSDSTISFLAEDTRHDPARDPAVVANANATGRRGNIHFFDSVRINRNNTAAGMTQLKAENHIWTAMLDYVDEASTGDTMEIISHKGDIYLGYNDNTAPQSPYQYVATMNNGYIMQQRPSASCGNPLANDVSYDKNRFIYTIPSTNTKGHLWIKAGWEEKTDRNSVPDDGSRLAGGNIYFSHIAVNQPTGSDHPTVISIPFSGLWRCGNEGDSILHNRSGRALQYYENAGIISGVNHCVRPYPGALNTSASNATDWGLFYRGGKGDLTVDAGNRGNIIFNKGAYLSFEDPSSTGNVVFRTRFGDIDMRNPFNVDTMTGSLLFLAQIENIADLEHSDFCGCKEERNNVYLQDFEFKAHGASGSVFVGADNNIKLNYGGLQNIGTRHDPFLSKDYEKCNDGSLKKVGEGYIGGALGGCGDDLHCDAISSENKARKFLMKFDKDANGTAITKGGFAAVASDYIDVYKRFEYLGGSGDGMGSVPGTGTLHGETVTGYGLFMKTQANKGNWNINVFENAPTCPTPCSGTSCDQDYLHMVSRMTFHDDAYIEAHNQEVMLWSPVIETFGDMTLDSEKDKGSKTEITLKADSLIFHSDFVKKGKNIKLSTWSGLHNDLPIMKFGHMRKTPPFVEAKKDDCDAITECVPCYRYIRFSKDPLHMLDTITIKFGDGAYMERLNTVVFDHTVLTCLTDSFDHVMGGAVQNAQIRTDTFKIRNQVDLFADEKHERDAHLELISEEQMGSKDYAGIYTKHLHMEPIGACGTPYSELWTSDDLALDVITTSIFGGFGFIHSDVHVENGGHLNAGFTSLRLKGMCYEHMCGTQRMKDLRLDVGAQLHFSVGTSKGLNGEYSDAIEVDRLTTYGSVDVNIEIRPCEKIEKRCYPIIYYKSVTPNSLNQLKLNPRKVKIDGEEYPLHLNLGTDGVVYVCVGDAQPVDINRTVTLPSVSGVKTDPGAGIWDVKSRGNFKFKATYSGSKPLAVRTNRTVNGVPEMLTGTKNANGEYEYVVPNVQQDITLSIGPDYVSNQLLAGTAVWSHGEMIYIRVDRADIASIYSVAGQLVRKVDLPEGDTSIPMSRGAYVITLKDGSVHKVIVK